MSIEQARIEQVRLRAFLRAAETQATKVLAELDDEEPAPEPEPTPDPPTEPTDSHEPDGHTLIAHHDGSELEPGAWRYWKNTNCNDKGDQGFAEAKNGVIVGHFNKGMGDPCGQRPFTLDHDLRGGEQLYIRMRVRLSENWCGHPSATNKMLYLRSDDTPGNGSPGLVIFRGSGDGGLRLDLLTQNSALPGGSQHWYEPNLASGEIVRAQWHDVEMILAWDRAEVWVDGEKTHEYTGEPIWHVEPFGWDNFSWDPVWGGAVEVLDRHQTMSVDGFYLSGA